MQGDAENRSGSRYRFHPQALNLFLAYSPEMEYNKTNIRTGGAGLWNLGFWQWEMWWAVRGWSGYAAVFGS